MDRRLFIGSGALLALRPAFAHHGWSSFDQTRPIYIEGRVVKATWRNPHAELDIETPAQPRLPADLASRQLPAQTAAVDGPALLKAAVLPKRSDRHWTAELAPITRMEAWGVKPIEVGQTVSLIGFTAPGEQGEPVLRVEYLFVGAKAYGLRSSPAA